MKQPQQKLRLPQPQQPPKQWQLALGGRKRVPSKRPFSGCQLQVGMVLTIMGMWPIWMLLLLPEQKWSLRWA
jgi:hypothetical protein